MNERKILQDACATTKGICRNGRKLETMRTSCSLHWPSYSESSIPQGLQTIVCVFRDSPHSRKCHMILSLPLIRTHAAYVHRNELDSVVVEAALQTLCTAYPDVHELQSQGPVTASFVQVFNSDHWVTVTNTFSSSPNDVYWYDSLRGTVSSVLQLTSLLCRSHLHLSSYVCSTSEELMHMHWWLSMQREEESTLPAATMTQLVGSVCNQNVPQ